MNKLNLCHFLTFIFISFSIPIFAKENLKEDNENIVNYSKRMMQFYELNKNEMWRDVTNLVLESNDTSPESKEAIRTNKRRIIVFKYPSDALWIKGFLSYTPNPKNNPLLILYRWGNQNFALMNPGVIYATYKNYTVVSSTLRGGVSEGKDEFGGADVNDMKNLIDHLPNIAHELGITLHPSCVFMLGPSRGGLEMFLTLSRFPELQKYINKVVALSAALDLHALIEDRPDDMKKMFQSNFGLEEGTKGEAWIAKRDPIKTIPKLKKSLPILIIQGTDDKRIHLREGYHMVDSLQRSGHDVNYWEIKKGNHVLMNTPHIMNDIARWLESDSTCICFRLSRQQKKQKS